MRYKVAKSDISFLGPYQRIKNFSDTDYNDFIDTIKKVEYKTAAQAGASHHCVHFYTNKSNFDIIRAFAAALNPEFYKKVKKITNEPAGANKHVQFMLYGNSGSPKCLVSEGKAYAQFFQNIKANGKIVRYSQLNPLVGYTQNGVAVNLTAANGNQVWLDKIAQTTTPANNLNPDGSDKTPTKQNLLGGGDGDGQGLFTTQNMLIAGAALLLLFVLLKKKKKE